ncbi:MAG: hypothetical protein M3R13_01970 [Armatimonadota bacterium]|nr:hypothetical protein [Armatimonadota bacterium]
MPTVALTVDCKAAHHDRCYTASLIDIAEKLFVPITWLIHISEADPSANTNLYYREYFHKIPSWHEVGMLVYFENERGYVDNAKERGNIIRIAKDTLKSHRVKATSFRAGAFALEASDIPYLEDIGILVSSSSVSGSDYKMFKDWSDGPTEPYHPSGENLLTKGDSKLLEVPVSAHGGMHAYLDKGFSDVQPVIDGCMDREVLCIGMRDHMDCSGALQETVEYLRGKGAHFSTLTQTSSEHFEQHGA